MTNSEHKWIQVKNHNRWQIQQSTWNFLNDLKTEYNFPEVYLIDLEKLIDSKKIYYSDEEINIIRDNLVLLNKYVAQTWKKKEPMNELNFPDWLYGNKIISVVRLENHDEDSNNNLALLKKHPIINPSNIPNLLAFMPIPKFKKQGIDIENHDGKGYHFHYGEVLKGSLQRYAVLLTFQNNHTETTNIKSKYKLQNPPLYSEPHGSNSRKFVDMSNMGKKRKEAIYGVCLNALKTRGIHNFLTPSYDSTLFYPESLKLDNQ